MSAYLRVNVVKVIRSPSIVGSFKELFTALTTCIVTMNYFELSWRRCNEIVINWFPR